MLFDFSRPRSSLAIPLCVALSLGAISGVRAATFHRLDITNTTGSEGAFDILQTTATGSAVQGEVTDGSVNTGVKLPFGVLGEYDPSSSSTFGVGVIGLSTSGYGVAAEAFGSNPAMIAESMGRGGAVESIVPASGATAIYALNPRNGPAVEADAANGNGIVASASADSALLVSSDLEALYGIFATNTAPASYYGQGLHVESESGSALVARSTSGNASYPVVALEAYKSGTDLLDIFTKDSNNNTDDPLRFTYPSANQSNAVADPSGGSDLQMQGDIYVDGNVFARCYGGYSPDKCSLEIAPDYSQQNDFRPEQTEPTIEDSGEIDLAAGHAHVALEPMYASMISSQPNYQVFTAAEGQSKGLYVYNKTSSGFDVGENGGGRSSLTVDYRIVAYPRGPRAARLPLRTAHAGTFAPRPSADVLAADAAADRFRSRMPSDMKPVRARPLMDWRR